MGHRIVEPADERPLVLLQETTFCRQVQSSRVTTVQLRVSLRDSVSHEPVIPPFEWPQHLVQLPPRAAGWKPELCIKNHGNAPPFFQLSRATRVQNSLFRRAQQEVSEALFETAHFKQYHRLMLETYDKRIQLSQRASGFCMS